LAAFGLKQYFDRSGRVSKTSDKDEATASLGHSEELSVQHSVGDAIPEFDQTPDDGTQDATVGGDAASDAGSAVGDGVEFSVASKSATCSDAG
jgi:hypothetical protein